MKFKGTEWSNYHIYCLVGHSKNNKYDTSSCGEDVGNKELFRNKFDCKSLSNYVLFKNKNIYTEK